MNDCSDKECVDRVYNSPIVVPKLPQAEAFIDPTNVASKKELADAIEEIKNNPDVVDIVATKVGLDNYDTSELTDKDIVKVLKDETQGGGISYYRWDTKKFTLIATLEKSTPETVIGDNGTSLVMNEGDGGTLQFTTSDGKKSGVAVNDGTGDILAELYAVTEADKTGSRVILNTDGAYYTKKEDATFDENDELVTKKTIESLNQKIAELEEKVNGLITPKTLTKDNIYNTPGTFIFTGNSDNEGTFPKEGCDWAGVQINFGIDAFQIVGSNGLWIRTNDAGVTEKTTKESWSKWYQFTTDPQLN